MNLNSMTFTEQNTVCEPHVVVEPGSQKGTLGRPTLVTNHCPCHPRGTPKCRIGPTKKFRSFKVHFCAGEISMLLLQPLCITKTMAPAKSARAKKLAAFEEKAVKGMPTFSSISRSNKHTTFSDTVTRRLRPGSECTLRGRQRQRSRRGLGRN